MDARKEPMKRDASGALEQHRWRLESLKVQHGEGGRERERERDSDQIGIAMNRPSLLCFALLCSALLCLLVSVSACPQYSLSSKSRSIRSDPVRGLRAIATYLCLLASG